MVYQYNAVCEYSIITWPSCHRSGPIPSWLLSANPCQLILHNDAHCVGRCASVNYISEGSVSHINGVRPGFLELQHSKKHVHFILQRIAIRPRDGAADAILTNNCDFWLFYLTDCSIRVSPPCIGSYLGSANLQAQ